MVKSNQLIVRYFQFRWISDMPFQLKSSECARSTELSVKSACHGYSSKGEVIKVSRL